MFFPGDLPIFLLIQFHLLTKGWGGREIKKKKREKQDRREGGRKRGKRREGEKRDEEKEGRERGRKKEPLKEVDTIQSAAFCL